MGDKEEGKAKKGLTGAALATSYLVLLTVTTAISQAFPCDEFDDETSYLRADYSINCKSGSYKFMIVYAGMMFLLYPVGILSLYSKLLTANKAGIKKSVDERSGNVDLMAKGFLFENYLPSCWWFEIAETLRRLTLTSVLGLIEPGSDTQLAAGLVMSVFGIMLFTKFEPYIQKRDNLLAILASVQIFFVMLIAFVMKRKEGGGELNGVGDEDFDDKYLGIMLIGLNVLLFGVFVGSGVVAQFIRRDRNLDAGGAEGGDRERVGTSLYDILSGLRESLGWGGKALPLANGFGPDSGQGIELGDLFGGGGTSIVGNANPMHIHDVDNEGGEKRRFSG